MTGVWARTGVTREVFLIGRYAFKLPKLTYGWKMFLQGLLCNMQEAVWGRSKEMPEFCPVVFSIPGGWLVVMKRAMPLTDEQWREFLRDRLGIDGIKSFHPRDEIKSWTGGDYFIPAEVKENSFGLLDGRVVVIDYGD